MSDAVLRDFMAKRNVTVTSTATGQQVVNGHLYNTFEVTFDSDFAGPTPLVSPYMQGTGLTDTPADRPVETFSVTMKDAFDYHNTCEDPQHPTPADLVAFAKEFGEGTDLDRVLAIFESCRQQYKLVLALLGNDKDLFLQLALSVNGD